MLKHEEFIVHTYSTRAYMYGNTGKACFFYSECSLAVIVVKSSFGSRRKSVLRLGIEGVCKQLLSIWLFRRVQSRQKATALDVIEEIFDTQYYFVL